MDENFSAIYKILKALKADMDLDESSPEMWSAKAIGINERRWGILLEMLQKDRYIDGLSVKEYITGARVVDADHVRITLNGLQYLDENSMMRKAANAARGIVETAGAVASIIKA